MYPTPNTLGAVYCVYEDSGFLAESFYRIYPVVDKVVYLINKRTWFGKADPVIISQTLESIGGLNDPDNKIMVIHGNWSDEATQRNFGLTYLRMIDISWCLIIDDDELYNTRQLAWAKSQLIPLAQAAYLVPFQLYWKTRETIVRPKGVPSIPCFCSTVHGKIHFNENRMIIVHNDTWITLDPNQLIYHHMSYVRSDGGMKRKLEAFSHANEIIGDWYQNIWLSQGDLKEVPAPTGHDTWELMPESESPYHLEPVQ